MLSVGALSIFIQFKVFKSNINAEIILNALLKKKLSSFIIQNNNCVQNNKVDQYNNFNV